MTCIGMSSTRIVPHASGGKSDGIIAVITLLYIAPFVDIDPVREKARPLDSQQSHPTSKQVNFPFRSLYVIYSVTSFQTTSTQHIHTRLDLSVCVSMQPSPITLSSPAPLSFFYRQRDLTYVNQNMHSESWNIVNKQT